MSATATTLMVAGGPAAIQGMSAATATLIAGGLAVAGTLLGVVVGLLVEYRLRRRGEVLTQARAWTGFGRGDWSFWGQTFEVRFFNNRDVNISLWDARVEFYRGGNLLNSIPTQRTDGTGDEVGPIDLESRKSVYLEMLVLPNLAEMEEAYDEQAETSDLIEKIRARLGNADRVEFVATTIPGRQEVRKPLPLWDDIGHPPTVT